MDTLWACPCWVSLSIQGGEFWLSPAASKVWGLQSTPGAVGECGPWRKISAPISSFPHLQPAHECCFPVEMSQAMSSFSLTYSSSKNAEHGPPPPALAQGLAVGQSTAHHPTNALAPAGGCVCVRVCDFSQSWSQTIFCFHKRLLEKKKRTC